MGDSDDDFERRRRDKFRGERSEYGGNRERRGGGGEEGRRREDWGMESHSFRGRENWTGRDRGNSRRGDYAREYGRTRERYSPVRHDMSPPMKRMRADWEERRYPYESSYPSYGNYGHEYPLPGGPPAGGGGGSGGGRLDELGPTQPPMMSFKSFMEQCDDTISEEEALKKYSDYKLEFKRQQLNEFFVNHKEEEWFKAKYHPEDSIKRREELITNLKSRVEVFFDLEKSGKMSAITVDADQSDQLLKLLESVVIKLEGGSDFDLQVLDLPPEEEIKPALPPRIPPTDDLDKKPFIVAEDSDDEKKTSAPDESLKIDVVDEEKELQKKAKEYLKQKSTDGEVRKRKRSGSSSSSSSSSSSDSDSDEEPPAPGSEEKTSEPLPPGMDTEEKENGVDNKEEEEEETKEEEKKEEEEKQTDSADAVEVIESTPTEEKEKEPVEETEKKEEDEEPKPRALHKITSIFLRNLAPTITKAEIESMCRRYPGFLRASIADPQPERRWFRRGWVSFKYDVNIKDICWNLNNIRLRDCEIGAIVNRELTRRIRTVNGITSHRAVVKSDIKLAAKIIQNLDLRWCIWSADSTGNVEVQTHSISNSANPVLCNITDYLIEEASAEEEELLGSNNENNGTNGDQSEGETIERDEMLIKVLDRLLLYLRIVHSVDYYNHSEYPNEDEMPNRCGIMHARGIPPSSKVTPQEIQDYTRTFENRIGSFIQPLTKLGDDETKKLGLKDADEEVDKFIHSNTQEVSKEKYQCPLCGKKFKASEFVHKHILNKHAEKVNEVKKEVDYFNNYLRDPKRPQLPEYPGNKQAGPRKDEIRQDPYVAAYPRQNPMYSAYPNYGNRYNAQPSSYGGYASSYPKDFYNRGDSYMRDSYPRSRAAYRSRVGYRDLDAPKDEY